MTARQIPARHWRSYGDAPLPTGREALDQPFSAFPSWFMRITCDRCGKAERGAPDRATARDSCRGTAAAARLRPTAATLLVNGADRSGIRLSDDEHRWSKGAEAKADKGERRTGFSRLPVEFCAQAGANQGGAVMAASLLRANSLSPPYSPRIGRPSNRCPWAGTATGGPLYPARRVATHR
jgi:hypothetical protein